MLSKVTHISYVFVFLGVLGFFKDSFQRVVKKAKNTRLYKRLTILYICFFTFQFQSFLNKTWLVSVIKNGPNDSMPKIIEIGCMPLRRKKKSPEVSDWIDFQSCNLLGVWSLASISANRDSNEMDRCYKQLLATKHNDLRLNILVCSKIWKKYIP